MGKDALQVPTRRQRYHDFRGRALGPEIPPRPAPTSPFLVLGPLSRRPSYTMAEITLRIKPTTGSPPFEVKTTREATVGDLKTEVARACDSPADLIRLIYKGQVLKDHATVESYGEPGVIRRAEFGEEGGKVRSYRRMTVPHSLYPGLEHDHVVHMVKSKGPPVNRWVQGGA